jgi:hypothetical protein
MLGGKPGLQEFLQYSKEEVEGDFEYDVIPGSTGPKTTESKRAQVMQEFQTMAPIVMQAGGNIRALLEYVAEYMGWKSVDKVWENPKNAAKELAAVLLGFSQGASTPEQLVDTASKMVMAELTPAEIGELKKQLMGQAPGQAQQAEGTRGDTNPMGTTAGTM